jgi:membrane fusion protein (multidrug efflux system)
VKAKHIIAGVALLVALVVTGIALRTWKKLSAGGPAHAGEPPQFVDFITAKGETWQPTGRLVGTIVPKRSIQLANEVAGVVTQIGFESGTVVEEGQLLVKLDTSTEEADLAAAQAAERLAAAAIDVAIADQGMAQTNVDWALANYDRYKGAPAKAVSESDVDRARTDLERAQSSLRRQDSFVIQMRAEADQARSRAEQIKTTIAKKTLKSPFRAMAGMRNIHPGQYLAEGTQIVLLNEVTDDIYLDFAIPQEYTPLVFPGTTVTATSNILGRGKANTAEIKVLSMDASVNPVTRNVRVRTSVPNKDQALKPGMFVDVEVPIGPSRQVVTVPTTAVRRAAFGDHVFALSSTPPPPPPPPPGVEPEKHEPPPPPKGDAPPAQQGPPPMWAVQRNVTLGTNLGDRVIIAEGLKEGEQIAAAGSFKLRGGAMVFQAPPKQPPSPDAPAETPAAATSSSR